MALVAGITIIAILFFKFVIIPEPKAWLREDGTIENIQAFLFLAATIGFAFAAIKSKTLKKGCRWRYLPIVGWAALMFIFFGEEISWGQRLFGLQTPATGIMASNIQGEINIHNLPIFHDSKQRMMNYMLIIVGVVLPIMVYYSPIKRLVRFFAFPTVPLSLIPLFIGTYLLHEFHIFSNTEYGYLPREYSETMIALAFALFAWIGAIKPDSLFHMDSS
jgi:hypothetical protein